MQTALVLLVVGVWILNYAISWFNARIAGSVWAEAKFIGGFTRLLVWCGAIMSAAGFTWCYMIAFLLGAYAGQFAFLNPGDALILDAKALEAGLSLGYLLVLPFILGSGLVIWGHSLVEAWRRRDALSIGIASWNTFAQLHNTYEAMRGTPEAFGKVVEFFGGALKGNGDARGKAAVIVALVVVLAAIAGILHTWAIINKYAGRKPLPARVSHDARQAA